MKSNSNMWGKPLFQSFIKKEEVKIPEKLIGYLIGPFGALLSSGIFTSVLQSYFTDVLKLNLTFLTTLQLFSTILIVIANLVVGQLIERTRTLAGKARPWILLSALTISIASVLMFIVPFQGTARYIWMAVAYNLFYSFAYPIYNTANATLVPLSTRDSGQRGILASLNNMAGLGVMGTGSMIFPMLVSFALKENTFLWFVAMLAVAIFTALTIFLQFKFTRERVSEELAAGSEAVEVARDQAKKEAAPSMKAQLSAVFTEKNWWIVILFYIGFQWSGAMKNGSMIYFCKWVLDNSFLGSADAWGVSQTILAVVGAVPMALAALLVVPLCKKYGKRLICMLGMLLGAVGGVIAIAGNGQIIPVAIGVGLKCLGSAPACYMILALLSDVIEQIEFKRHLRTDGLIMSIYSSIMVAATPICNAIFSGILNGAGYKQDADVALGVMAQSAGAKAAISISYIWIETICYVICGILIIFFTAEKRENLAA